MVSWEWGNSAFQPSLRLPSRKRRTRFSDGGGRVHGGRIESACDRHPFRDTDLEIDHPNPESQGLSTNTTLRALQSR